MKESKKEVFRKNLTRSLDKILENLKDEQIDFLALSASNHNGNLQVDYTIRERTKIY